MGEEINLKDSFKDKKIILATLIVVVVVIISSWYIFFREDLHGKVEFSISFDKTNYSLDESINVTFKIVNIENRSIEVSEYRYSSTIQIYMWNSTLEKDRIFLNNDLGPSVDGIRLESGESYEFEINIEPYINNNLKNDTYYFQGHYANYNPYEGDIDWYNGSEGYDSNEVELVIISP